MTYRIVLYELIPDTQSKWRKLQDIRFESADPQAAVELALSEMVNASIVQPQTNIHDAKEGGNPT